MAVDPYSECPCGSGKKLKFCCSDLYADLDKVHRMIEGDQPRAALQHVVQALESHPGRGSLLDLKATLELSLGEHEEARGTIKEYLKVDPQNPGAHAQAAILECSTQHGKAGVESLQRAFELVADQIPARVLQAVGAVGQALLVQGDMVAARAHLWLYQGIAGRRDSSAMELLLKLNQVSGLPLLLRDNLYMHELPAGHEAEQAHDHAQMLASRGQWARAAAELERLVETWPDLPVLRYNHALVRGWLGDTARFVTGLREFAQCVGSNGVTWDDAVEAEAIAQLLSEELREPPLDVVKTTIAVQDEEHLIDRLSRDTRADAQAVNQSELAGEQGPPPRNAFLLLDRPLPEVGAELSQEQVPRVCGIISYYGRQTDREARVEYVADRGERFADSLATLREIVGDALGEVQGEEVIGKSASASVLDTRWRFPADTPITVRKAILQEHQRSAILEVWPEKPLAALGDRSPVEASKEEGTKVSLAAAVLNFEEEVGRRTASDHLDDLRKRLELEQPTPIDPQQVDLMTLPLIRLPRVDLKQASNEEMITLFERAGLSGSEEAQLLVAREAITRDDLEERLPRESLYQCLVTFETDPSRALSWVDQAREEAEAASKSSAPWDIIELELRVVSGDIDEANRLVQHIRDDHINEPGVAEQLYRMLYSLGAITPGQQSMHGPSTDASAAEESASAGSNLWTPDGEADRSSGEKKIWTPT